VPSCIGDDDHWICLDRRRHHHCYKPWIQASVLVSVICCVTPVKWWTLFSVGFINNWWSRLYLQMRNVMLCECNGLQFIRQMAHFATTVLQMKRDKWLCFCCIIGRISTTVGFYNGLIYYPIRGLWSTVGSWCNSKLFVGGRNDYYSTRISTKRVQIIAVCRFASYKSSDLQRKSTRRLLE